MSIYEEHGYDSRTDYLKSLAEDYEIPLEDVFQFADMLGSSEDFDGLLSTLEDYEAYQELYFDDE